MFRKYLLIAFRNLRKHKTLVSCSTFDDPRIYEAEGLRTNWSNNSFNTYMPKLHESATARSAGRVREVGMRKVVGALRTQLMGQFLSESILLVILGIATVLVLICLPALNAFTREELASGARCGAGASNEVSR